MTWRRFWQIKTDSFDSTSVVSMDLNVIFHLDSKRRYSNDDRKKKRRDLSRSRQSCEFQKTRIQRNLVSCMNTLWQRNLDKKSSYRGLRECLESVGSSCRWCKSLENKRDETFRESRVLKSTKWLTKSHVLTKILKGQIAKLRLSKILIWKCPSDQ